MAIIELELRFVPSRIEGLPKVSEVIVYPDRLELLSAGEKVVFRFEDVAKWPRPRWLHKLLFRLGWEPRWLTVADRDWFHKPPDRFFRFYTYPQIVIYMPVDEPYSRSESYFLRLQQVLGSGGLNTFDLG